MRVVVKKDPIINATQYRVLTDAFIRLEGALRAAHSCDYEQMLYDLQLAEFVAQLSRPRERDSAEESLLRAQELQKYLDLTGELTKNVLPKILSEECGCKRK